MNKCKKKISEISLSSFLLVISITLLAVGCNKTSQEIGVRSQEVNLQLGSTPTPIQAEEVKSDYIKYQGQEGKNALDLLKQTQKVTLKTYAGVGEFVNGINGLESDSKHFWSFYVNGAQATVGASTYTTKSTDVIEWKFEGIK